MTRDKHNHDPFKTVLQLNRQLDAVHKRHVNIDQGQMRLMLLRLKQRLLAVPCLTAYPVAMLLPVHFEPQKVTEQRLVVNNHHLVHPAYPSFHFQASAMKAPLRFLHRQHCGQ
ncbi:hypothetical protein D3C75_734260 [compost metagenome]